MSCLCVVYMCMWAVCSGVCLCAWGQRPEKNGLLYHFLPYVFETKSLINPGAMLVVSKASNPPVTACQQWAYRPMHPIISEIPGFLHVGWDPNSDRHGFVGSDLTH